MVVVVVVTLMGEEVDSNLALPIPLLAGAIIIITTTTTTTTTTTMTAATTTRTATSTTTKPGVQPTNNPNAGNKQSNATTRSGDDVCLPCKDTRHRYQVPPSELRLPPSRHRSPGWPQRLPGERRCCSIPRNRGWWRCCRKKLTRRVPPRCPYPLQSAVATDPQRPLCKQGRA